MSNSILANQNRPLKSTNQNFLVIHRNLAMVKNQKHKFGIDPSKRVGHSFSGKRDIPASRTDITGKGLGKLRSNATINRLKMYTSKVSRDKNGNIIKGSVLPESQKIAPGKMARIQPDRRWFGNTKVIGQKELDKFRDELKKKIHDPYTVLMKQAKIPFSLLKEPEGATDKIMNRINFEETFGAKAIRKRPKIKSADVTDLLATAEKSQTDYQPNRDSKAKELDYMRHDHHDDPIFLKGQSKRIWSELYKVIDASDVIIQVLDARDPMGTRSPPIEKYIKKEKSYKHLIFVLNKCDLVPTWVTSRWVKILSKEYPTIAFHASITNPFGKGSLIQLLRQFAQLHKDKKNISVGFFGYPNVGKSSIINTLRKKKVCKAAPIPGETKVWQYVTLFRRVFLIDCPGVVYHSSDTQTDIILKSVVRIENIENVDHIEEVLKRVKKEYLQKHYKIVEWKDHVDFLTQIAKKSGKLHKNGKPDLTICARKVLHDWIRGRIPWFVVPPFEDQMGEQVESKNKALDISQRIGNIRLTEEFRFLKEDRVGTAYGVEPEEIAKTMKVQEKVVDWDEIYNALAPDELERQLNNDFPEDEDEEEAEDKEINFDSDNEVIQEDQEEGDEIQEDFDPDQIEEEEVEEEVDEEVLQRQKDARKKEMRELKKKKKKQEKTVVNGYIPARILQRMKAQKEAK
jgi:nuclear GTP-binding protein